ncbi:uncharacterized protein TrAFT101_004972 [Trichoderma asperellum]|uniref:uncharacterized protein n=1 Tax=Trichoderma asperellum TaxID=101201 RepID=UPI00332177D7|nr:hypothetical protein TrAFT101_004972 [Trichoderma asperellum]
MTYYLAFSRLVPFEPCGTKRLIATRAMDNEAPSKDPVTGRWYFCENGGPTGIRK